MIQNFMTSMANVIRLGEPVSDGSGGWTQDEIILVTDLPCRVVALSGSEVAEFARIGVEASYALYCLPQAEEIKEKDIVEFGGLRYDILFVDNVHQLNRYLKLILRIRK